MKTIDDERNNDDKDKNGISVDVEIRRSGYNGPAPPMTIAARQD